MTSFTVFGPVTGKARPRHGQGRTYTPTKTRLAEAGIVAAAMQARVERLSGPVRLVVVALRSPPQKWSKARQRAAQWDTRKPDADNVLKLVADALNGIAYVDDCQIVEAIVYKRMTDGPERLFVTVEPMEDAG